MTHNIILDVDTGIDDAMAIMFAARHPQVAIKAISCVAGNTSVDRVGENTLRVLDLIHAPDIPVAIGARRPLIEEARSASEVHGESGLGNVSLPPTLRKLDDRGAIELLRSTLMSSDQPISIVALAPQTNIALLLRTYPEVVDHIERIVFMGGAVGIGNATAAAEFNVWHDPEAAHIVLNSGVPLTMYGLDVFFQVRASDQQIEDLQRSGDPVAHALGELLGFEAVDEATGQPWSNPIIGDAGAVCALVAPELFTFETHPTQVELAPGIGRGQTLVDRRAVQVDHDREPWPEVQIAVGCRPEDVLELFLETVLHRP